MVSVPVTMLVHGPSKAGKSLFAASTPGPRLYLDVEMAARFLPLQAVTWDALGPPPEPDDAWDTCIVPIRKWEDATRVMKYIASGKHPFRSVSLDSVSELQQRYLESVAGRGAVQLQQWGSALREVRGLLQDLRDATNHPTTPLDMVVVTAMTKLKQDGRWWPYLQGAVADAAPYLFDVTAYIDVVPGPDGTEARTLYTRKTPKFMAGERVSGAIPPLLGLPVVTGTRAEVSEKNTAAAMIQLMVSQAHETIAAPAVVDTTPSDFSAASATSEWQDEAPIHKANDLR